MGKVLVVEDQSGVREALAWLFSVHDIPCVLASSPAEALNIIRNEVIACVIQDMNFSPGATDGQEGVTLFRCLREIQADLPILLVSAWTSVEAAVQLMKEGAQDYLQKPWDDEALIRTIQPFLKKEIKQETMPGLIAESIEMKKIIELARSVAASDVPVLITGPNGVGKEKIADLIHQNSNRNKQPIIKVNAGAIPTELFESEFFGAEAGAYTGIQKKRIGFLEEAGKGTLFLDEIGNLNQAGQMKLLRVLQSGDFQRLGSSKTLKAECRILAATNENLWDLIDDGRFRQDLLFRINVMEIHIPAIQDRPADILPLANYFIQKKNPHLSLSTAAEKSLHSYSWPGNVREIENCIERAMILCGQGPIQPSHLRLHPERSTMIESAGERDPEAQRIERILIKHAGQISSAARELGISRQALYRKMEKFEIELKKIIDRG